MESFCNSKRGHVVCVPYPAQGHISPMLKLAKILHQNGFYLTFVNTEFNHKRLLRSNGAHSLDGLPDFRFETIPDGLPPSDDDATQHIPSLCASTSKNCSAPFRGLINKINAQIEITCIVSDGVMSFTLEVAEEFGIPEVLFWTTSACGFLCYLHYQHLVQRGYTPLKDESHIRNGYLETAIDWVPGMLKDMRLRDFPSFIRTTDPNDIMLNYFINETERISKAKAIILNTFDAFEQNVLNALLNIHPHVYTIGPLQLMLKATIIDGEKLKSIGGSNLWKEDLSCIEWLDTQESNSVVYVNFGSITVMNFDQFTEMAWGLANTKKPFLWVIRPDLIAGDSVTLPEEFLSEIKDRGMIANWCPQEKVLKHGAIGGFLTHSGWNSTLDSICAGVPVLCWPFFAEQQTNCRYSCSEWETGMEIIDLKRSEVEILVRELMDGEKGKKMKLKAMYWKEEAEKATAPGGSSSMNLNKLFNEVALSSNSSKICVGSK